MLAVPKESVSVRWQGSQTIRHGSQCSTIMLTRCEYSEVNCGELGRAFNSRTEPPSSTNCYTAKCSGVDFKRVIIFFSGGRFSPFRRFDVSHADVKGHFINKHEEVFTVFEGFYDSLGVIHTI